MRLGRKHVHGYQVWPLNKAKANDGLVLSIFGHGFRASRDGPFGVRRRHWRNDGFCPEGTIGLCPGGN